MKPGYESVVRELLTNIKRSCIRGRNAAQTESNMIATCDHIENLADEALSYMDTDLQTAPNTALTHKPA